MEHLLNLVLLLVGTFMDPTPAVLIFTPIFLPIVTELGKKHGVDLGQDVIAAAEGKAQGLGEKAMKHVAAIAKELAANRGKGAVVAGRGQPAEVHAVVQLVNNALGNVGADRPVRLVAAFDEGRDGPSVLVELAQSIGADNRNQLAEMARDYGDDLEESGTVAGALHRQHLPLALVLTGLDGRPGHQLVEHGTAARLRRVLVLVEEDLLRQQHLDGPSPRRGSSWQRNQASWKWVRRPARVCRPRRKRTSSECCSIRTSCLSTMRVKRTATATS